MLVGFDSNNVFRNSGELGEWARNLVERIASQRGSDFRALLFATRMKEEYRSIYTSFANVSTFVPSGASSLMPSTWMRFSIGPYLTGERVQIFHGLNEELPYHLTGKVKTVITCFGKDVHYTTSLFDKLFWKKRLRYAIRTADALVAVSEEVKNMLLAKGVKPEKIVVIGNKENPYEVTDEVARQYLALYNRLLETED